MIGRSAWAVAIGDEGKRIAQPDVEPAWQPEFLSHADGQHAAVNKHRRARVVGRDVKDLQCPLIVESVPVHGGEQADTPQPQTAQGSFRPLLGILACWIHHEPADEPIRVLCHSDRDRFLVPRHARHEGHPRDIVLVQLCNPAVCEVRGFTRRLPPQHRGYGAHRFSGCQIALVSRQGLEESRREEMTMCVVNHGCPIMNGLGAAKRFVDDFVWSGWRFEISVFDPLGVGRGQRIDETVERSKVATVAALDRLLDAVIARDEDRVGSPHVSEVLGGVRFATPCGKPFFEGLTAGKHRRKRFGIVSLGDTCEVTEKEGEIDRLGAQEIETFLDELDGCLRRETKFGAEAGDVLAAESLRISRERGFGDRGCLTRILRKQRPQGLREAGEVPEPDVRLVAPGIARTVVDGAEDALRVEGVHERARAIVDRLSRNGRVVRVHHTVDEAKRHPLGDQIRLGSHDRLQQRHIRIWRFGGVRVVPRNGMIRKESQGIDIVACKKVLKGPDANVTGRHAGEHGAEERPFLAHDVFASRNSGECPGRGNPKRGHRFADNVFAEHRAERRFAIATAREWRAP